MLELVLNNILMADGIRSHFSAGNYAIDVQTVSVVSGITTFYSIYLCLQLEIPHLCRPQQDNNAILHSYMNLQLIFNTFQR